ncbi:hypothetical protein BGZ60DRAFT_522818 [Tricladium varicosporioides]|nr:hypothetical protein BGZ60DRAFT_522818 [Hymenoscyphus varicosporioides]
MANISYPLHGVQNYTLLDGHIVERTFNPGYVVLSYLISYVGAWTTVEIINKRTTLRGSWNWSILLAAAISMGGVATWCMHFVGNRAIILGDGNPQIQIAYSPGYTALSFFVSVSVLFAAFCTVGSNERMSLARVSLGGTLAGLGFLGMHYLGQAGVSNYTCVYVVAFVVAAAIVACGASIGALGLFFFFRAAWNSTWWKRAISAFILSVGVSGMHWLATLGTRYRLKRADPSLASAFANSTTVIVVIALSVLGCIGLIFLSILAQAQKARAANRAQQVVLATAVFDKEGKLLVTPEGLLPNRKITNQYLEKSFNDVFNASHPSFLWMYRTTYYWAGVSSLVPAMKTHLTRAGLTHHHLRSKSQANLLNEEGTPIEDYSVIFRELFCLAAWEIANSFKIPMDDLGILYDEIVTTGNKSRKGAAGGRKSIFTATSTVADERKTKKTKDSDVPMMGKGQLLFLVNRVERKEAEQLQTAGYRFAPTESVIPILATSLQVSEKDLTRRFDMMLDYATDSLHMLEPGVHIACFAIRASIGAGFDVLARKDAKNQLPTMQLPFDTLEPWQLEYLQGMDLMSVAATMKMFNKASKKNNPSATQREFAQKMLKTLEAIKDEIDDPFFNDAQLIAKPMEAPCRGPTPNSPPGTALLITYKIIVPIHARAPGKKLEFAPLNLFRMQQRVYKNAADHRFFAKETFNEFSRVLELSEEPEPLETRKGTMGKLSFKIKGRSPAPTALEARIGDEVDMFGNRVDQPQVVLKSPKIKFWDRDSSPRVVRGDNSSEKNLIQNDSEEVLPKNEDANIDPRTTATNRPRSLASNKATGEKGIEMKNLPGGQKPGTGPPQKEGKTFVDEMFAITIKTKEGAHV